MKKIVYFFSFAFLLGVGQVAQADIPSLSGSIQAEYPWYAYAALGMMIIIGVSISLVLLAKIKYRNQQKQANDKLKQE